ncbi:MAG: potassium-transporting ATPase subunit KdpA [Herpetosiphonaceae bacterium]|nr:potassium-transporting ATPase subunit KdpA [Herpetosiphonaceae bacterium]
MTTLGWLQIAIYFALLLLLTKPLGVYMYRVFTGERTFMHPVIRPLERLTYRLMAVREDEEQDWVGYTVAVLLFSFVGVVATYLQMRIQAGLPLNYGMAPDGKTPFANVPAGPAFNTAVSFLTNTNWQSYSGESTMSYLTQMMQLTFHNFVSAGAGAAVVLALIRGLTRRQTNKLGNFYVDLTRCILYLLLPICIVYALFLVSQGTIQNLKPYVAAATIQGTPQIVPMGPNASQEAIKMLGINGGGFFNANSAHPLTNPSPLTNFIEMLSIFSLPAGLTYMFGRMVGRQRQGWAIFAVFSALFLTGVAVTYPAEAAGNPNLRNVGVDDRVSAGQAGGNMEGKETRFGITHSALFAVITTDASCGAVIAGHDSFTPLGGAVPLFNMMSGEVIFGGVGSGLYGMLVFVIVAVFVAGLMVGRTPEYLGKKIEAFDIKMATLAILVPSFVILLLSAVASVLPAGTSSIFNGGPHGLSEILYAYSSGVANNGSAFAGLGANTDYYNSTIGVAMFLGRFFIIIPVLALAGSLASKKLVPASSGTFPTDGPLFVGLVIGVVVIVGGLTFFPALALGPLVDHLLMNAGQLF